MEYKTIRLKIKPTSPFKTKLQSDTIFGIFAWNYKYLYGNEKFKTFLSDFSNSPSIVFSDGFFEGYLPRPILEPLRLDTVLELISLRMGDERNSSSDALNILLKRIKKMETLPESLLLELLGSPLSEIKIFEALLSDKFPTDDEKSFQVVSLIKNTINRITGIVEEGLYQSNEIFYNKNFVIYAKFNPEKLSLSEIEEIFKLIGDFGFGADKSTGKGRFELLEISEEFELKKFMDPELYGRKNTVISLSSALIFEGSTELLYGKTFVKFGKLGGDKANVGMHFKNPLVLYKPGSTFKVSKAKHIYGNSTSEVFIDRVGVHSGFFIPLFFEYKGEEL